MTRAVITAMLAGAVAVPLLAAAHAAPPTIATGLPPGPVRSRILTGTSSEGTEVEAYPQGRAYGRIIVEELNETGRVISDFRFDHGALAAAHVVRVGYQGYPNADMAAVPPHRHLVIDPTDTILADLSYDFADAAHPCTGTDCAADRQATRNAAAQYVRLMNTPSPGVAEDEGNWECIPAGGVGCQGFRHDMLK